MLKSKLFLIEKGLFLSRQKVQQFHTNSSRHFANTDKENKICALGDSCSRDSC